MSTATDTDTPPDLEDEPDTLPPDLEANPDDDPGALALGLDPAPPAPKRRGRPPKAKPAADTAAAAPADEPKRRRRTAKPKAAEAPKPPTQRAISDALAGVAMFALIGAASTGNPRLVYDAEVIAANVERIAAELHRVAKINPALCRALTRLLKSSDYAGLVGLVGAIAVPILANHGLIPMAALAVVPGAKMPPAPPERAAAPADDEPSPSPAAPSAPGVVQSVGSAAPRLAGPVSAVDRSRPTP